MSNISAVLTHAAPKQVAGEDEKEMEMYKQYVYNHQPFLIVYFDQKHQHQLQFLQRNNECRAFKSTNKRGSLTRKIRVSKCEASEGFDFRYSYRLKLKTSSPLFTKRFFLAISVWRTDLVSGSKSMSWRISLAASAWCGAVNRAKPIGFSALKFN